MGSGDRIVDIGVVQSIMSGMIKDELEYGIIIPSLSVVTESSMFSAVPRGEFRARLCGSFSSGSANGRYDETIPVPEISSIKPDSTSADTIVEVVLGSDVRHGGATRLGDANGVLSLRRRLDLGVSPDSEAEDRGERAHDLNSRGWHVSLCFKHSVQ